VSWNPDIVPDDEPIGLASWVLLVVRGLLILAIIYTFLIFLILIRLIEYPFKSHPVSQRIVQVTCYISLLIMGLRVQSEGTPMTHKGAVVSNHASWLDIFALNAPQKVYFVSKAEVSGWPVIGWIARGTGTVFIQRKSRDAAKQKALFEARLDHGDRLLFFPEGTSTDTRRVLGFKSTLFAAFFEPRLIDAMWIQPVSLTYRAPVGEDQRFYGWWGEMLFMPHLLKTLGARRAGRIFVVFHAPVRVRDFADRKSLAKYCEDKVREGMRWDL